MDAAWIFIALAAVVVLAALMVYLLPPRRGSQAEGTELAPATPSSPSGSLARGFGYLQVSSGPTGRRGGVHSRLQRAFQRIDAVDPHAGPRRVGEALAQLGPADLPAPPTPVASPAVLWVDPPLDQPEERP